MNKKEINEIRRQLTPDRGLKKIYGCYVNTNKEIISYIEESQPLPQVILCNRYELKNGMIAPQAGSPAFENTRQCPMMERIPNSKDAMSTTMIMLI